MGAGSAAAVGAVAGEDSAGALVAGNAPQPIYAGNKTNYVHPTSESLDAIASSYNAYVSSVDHEGGVRWDMAGVD